MRARPLVWSSKPGAIILPRWPFRRPWRRGSARGARAAPASATGWAWLRRARRARGARLGGSSVCYELGLFAQGAPRTAAAGHFIHVYVDRASRRPVPLPPALRAVLQALVMPG